MFDDERRVNEIVESLAKGELTEDGKFLVFNKLADFQPLTQSEMPVAYLKAGRKR